MKLLCPRDELSKALQTVLRSVGARAGIPALAGVLMELDDQKLSLTTTDLEITTKVDLPVSGQAGQALLPARLLSEIVRNLPSDDVEFVQDNGSMRVSGRTTRFDLRSLPAEDFPRVQPSDEQITFAMDSQAFGAALGQVVTAASRDETRPVLTGVLFEGEGDELRLVATDSYRLALRTLQVPGSGEIKILVPARAVAEVVRMAGSGEIRVLTSGSQVAFEAGPVVLRSRLIEGEFPAYRQLLPEGLPNVLEAERSSLIESLRRIGVLAQDATPVFLELEDGAVRMTCQSQGLGNGDETVEGDYTGEPMRVAFNPGYLSQGVEAAGTERVRIELGDPQRPALVKAVGDDSFRYLLMPIRVS